MTEPLKADSSDRPQPSQTTTPSIRLNRKQMMLLLLAVVMLLLLVFGLRSVLAPSSKSTSDKMVSLPSSASQLENSTEVNSEFTLAQKASSINGNEQPQPLHPPEIAEVTTENQPITEPVKQQRIEIPGELTDLLIKQGEQIQQESIATGSQNSNNSALLQQHTQSNNIPQSESKQSNSTVTATRHQSADVNQLSSTHYTIQLSSGSNRDNLQQFAQKQQIKNYRIYETQREGKPWFVLITGNYSTTAEAKKAIATLPAAVKQKQPWVKPGSRVQEEQRMKK